MVVTHRLEWLKGGHGRKQNVDCEYERGTGRGMRAQADTREAEEKRGGVGQKREAERRAKGQAGMPSQGRCHFA